MPGARPSELELQVLSVLWELGPSSVRAVMEVMPDGKSRAYTTILSVMQTLEKKGLVDHTQQGAANVYRAVKPRGQVLRPLMRDMLRNIFGGSPARAVQSLLDGASLDPAEIARIREVIRQAEAASAGLPDADPDAQGTPAASTPDPHQPRPEEERG